MPPEIVWLTPDVRLNDLVFRAGDPSVDLVVVESGAIQIVRAATQDAPEEVVVRHGPGQFVGASAIRSVHRAIGIHI